MDYKTYTETKMDEEIERIRNKIQVDRYTDYIRGKHVERVNRILPVNRKTILALDIRNANNGIKKPTRAGYLKLWMHFGDNIKRPFLEVTREEMDEFLYKMKTGEIMYEKCKPVDGTYNTHIATIKRLYKMLGESSEKEPDCMKSLVKVRDSGGLKKIEKEHLFTPKDIERMVHAEKKVQYKALIKTLFESGMRISEFLSVNVGDVQFREDMAVLTPQMSKTRVRTIPIINSLPELKEWLNEHPRNHDKEAPLWITSRNNAMNNAAVKRILECAVVNAGLTKKIYPHLLRHSAVTWRKRMGMQREEANMLYGWSSKSNMYEHYSHFNIDDMFNRVRQQSGLPTMKKPEENEPLKQYELCPICGNHYPVGHKICGNCNMPLDNADRIKRVEEIQKQAEIIEEFQRLRPLLSQMKALEPILSKMLEGAPNGVNS